MVAILSAMFLIKEVVFPFIICYDSNSIFWLLVLDRYQSYLPSEIVGIRCRRWFTIMQSSIPLLLKVDLNKVGGES